MKHEPEQLVRLLQSVWTSNAAQFNKWREHFLNSMKSGKCETVFVCASNLFALDGNFTYKIFHWCNEWALILISSVLRIGSAVSYSMSALQQRSLSNNDAIKFDKRYGEWKRSRRFPTLNGWKTQLVSRKMLLSPRCLLNYLLNEFNLFCCEHFR